MKVNKEAESKLKIDHLKEILNYDNKTGIFTNKVTRSSTAVKGTEAGNLGSSGYVDITINGSKYKAHRLAWFYTYEEWPINLIDHKDRIKHHNWIDNLREATNSQNIQNCKYHTGKYKGVYFDRKKWRAVVCLNNKNHYLGNFNTSKEAAMAYNKKAVELHGEFAVLNKI